jgi:hypothetical protein
LFDEIALCIANVGVPSFIFSLDDLRVSESRISKTKRGFFCISLNSAFQTIEFHAKYPRFVSQSARDFG